MLIEILKKAGYTVALMLLAELSNYLYSKMQLVSFDRRVKELT